MQKTRGQWMIERFVALRFNNEADVDRAIALVNEANELKNMPWDTPDGWELHIPESAEVVFTNSGLKYKRIELEAA